MEPPTGTASESPQPNLARLRRLEGFLAVDADNANLLREYAREAFRVGHYEPVVSSVDRLRLAQASSSADDGLAAAALRRMGRLEEAMQRLTNGLTERPDDPCLRLELARCHMAARQFELALDALPPEQAEDELAGEGAALRIRLLHHLGRFDDIEVGLESWPANVRAADAVQAALLPVLVDLGDLDEAVRIAQQLNSPRVDGSPAPYEVAEPLALAALDAGHSQEALAWIDGALRARQDDGRIWLSKGMAHMQAGQPSEGRAAMQEAVRLMPEHAGSHLALGWAHLVAGDRPQARAAFEAGVAASPSFAEGHGSLAVVDAMEGRAEAARMGIRKAQGLDAQCASAQFAALVLRDPTGQDVRRLADRVLAQTRRLRRASMR